MDATANPIPLPFDDKVIVAGAIRKERRAQDAIYDKHSQGVYRLAFRMCNDADMASDLTQETFIRAFNALDGFRHESTLATWIHRIAVTVILSALRTTKRRDARRAPIELAGSIGHFDHHTDVPLRESLFAAIDALPDGYRTVFIMYEIEGYTHPEIAGALGVSVSTSQGQLFRARAKLRQSLSQFGGETRS